MKKYPLNFIYALSWDSIWTFEYFSHIGRVSFTEPNIQNVPKDFEIQIPTLIEESQPSQNCASKMWYSLISLQCFLPFLLYIAKYISYMFKIVYLFQG